MVVSGQNALLTMVKSKPSEVELHLGRGWLTSENALVRHVNRNDANGYYKTLGLLPNATKDEIKIAYRKLVKRLHPDLGGNEELFRFVAEIASVLLDSETKRVYDSVGNNAIYIGDMEREELARVGVHVDGPVRKDGPIHQLHWACLTTSGFPLGKETDAWIELCREVSPAVGYRGKIRAGVIEGGRYWPCDPSLSWGILTAGFYTFAIFQRGVEPNRLHALCAMIDWQKHLLKLGAQVQDRERTLW